MLPNVTADITGQTIGASRQSINSLLSDDVSIKDELIAMEPVIIAMIACLIAVGYAIWVWHDEDK